MESKIEKVEFIKIDTSYDKGYCRITFFVQKNVIFYISNFILKNNPLICYYDESWFDIIKRTHYQKIFSKITDMDWDSDEFDVQCVKKCCEQFVEQFKKIANDGK